MARRDKDPPLLRGFSSSKTGRGKALTSPTTSIWMAIVFMAIFFALMSVQRNVKRANEALKPPDAKHSGWIVDAPEQIVKRDPPPNPNFMFNLEEEEPILLQSNLELEKNIAPLEIKPIEVELEVKMPTEFQQVESNPN